MIDYRAANARNKITITGRVITGSYNFTISAEKRNAADVTLISTKMKMMMR